jgi:hypothetical protein
MSAGAPLSLVLTRRRLVTLAGATGAAVIGSAGFAALLLQVVDWDAPGVGKGLLLGLGLAVAVPFAFGREALRAHAIHRFAKRGRAGELVTVQGAELWRRERSGTLIPPWHTDVRHSWLTLGPDGTGIEVEAEIARACRQPTVVNVHRDGDLVRAIELGGRTWWPHARVATVPVEAVPLG